METFCWQCLYFCVYIFWVAQTSSLGHWENKIIVDASQGRLRAYCLPCSSCSVCTHMSPSLLRVGTQQLRLLPGLSQFLGDGMGKWPVHLISRHIMNAGEWALTREYWSQDKKMLLLWVDLILTERICVLRNEHMSTHTHKTHITMPPYPHHLGEEHMLAIIHG